MELIGNKRRRPPMPQPLPWPPGRGFIGFCDSCRKLARFADPEPLECDVCLAAVHVARQRLLAFGSTTAETTGQAA